MERRTIARFASYRTDWAYSSASFVKTVIPCGILVEHSGLRLEKSTLCVKMHAFAARLRTAILDHYPHTDVYQHTTFTRATERDTSEYDILYKIGLRAYNPFADAV